MERILISVLLVLAVLVASQVAAPPEVLTPLPNTDATTTVLGVRACSIAGRAPCFEARKG
jgi:hypothetical protein